VPTHLTKGDVITLPAVVYNYLDEATNVTVSLQPDSFFTVVGSTSQQLNLGPSEVRSATFRRILLINAHGGNAEPLDRAQRRLRGEGRDVRAWAPSSPGDARAGRTETSLMLALVPERVRQDEASAGIVAPIAELLGRLRAGGVRAISPNGVLGDPAGASADEGHELLRAASEELVAMVDAWDRGA